MGHAAINFYILIYIYEKPYYIVSSHLGYRKVCARGMPNMLTEHKNRVLHVL
jgi:hypothetical protein